MPHWRDYWTGNDDRTLVHPDAPAGGGGCLGRGRIPGITSYSMDAPLPHPDSPAGRRITPETLQRIDREDRARCVYSALERAQVHVYTAIKEETGYALKEVLQGVLPGIIMAVGIIGASTVFGGMVGAAIGALAGGIGAVPGVAAGAAFGFKAGLMILNFIGIGFLAVHIADKIHQVTQVLILGIKQAWDAPDSHSSTMERLSIEHASRQIARSFAILIRLILEGIVLYLLSKGGAKGVKGLVNELKQSKLGEGFALWVEANWEGLMKNPKLQPKKTGGISSGDTGVSASKQSRPGNIKEPKATGSKQITKYELEKWYQKQNDVFKDPDYMASHARGTDFSKPVYQKTLPEGTEIIQYQGTRGPGMYAAYPETSMESLAINGERTLVTYKTTAPLEVIESTAAKYPVGQIPNVGGAGGGQQLILPSGWQNAVRIIP